VITRRAAIVAWNVAETRAVDGPHANGSTRAESGRECADPPEVKG
jgi:hypothetical protein